MKYSKNQIGRILLQRLLGEVNCDMQMAIRFFYNSDFYSSLQEDQIIGDVDEMYKRLIKEFEFAK